MSEIPDNNTQEMSTFAYALLENYEVFGKTEDEYEIGTRDKLIQYIGGLESKVAELEAAQRWYVVDDGDLPIVGKSIMFYDSSSEEIYRGVYTASHHWRANYFSEKCETVTHWMPLPPEVK